MNQIILIVDDSNVVRTVVSEILQKSGYASVAIGDPFAAPEMIEKNSHGEVVLVITDVEMPGMNGIDLCSKIKSGRRGKDVPVIVITSLDRVDVLGKAFDAGAADFLNKPFRKIELLARVRSLVKLFNETEQRKQREQDLLQREQELLDINRMLEVANQTVMLTSSIDSLTGVTNRRTFDNFMSIEWPRAQRSAHKVSIAMIDIDYFKRYNDSEGHQAGDSCLQAVASAMKSSITRSNMIFARYGGEEFILFIPGMMHAESCDVAETMVQAVSERNIPHSCSDISDRVTVSIGLATKTVLNSDSIVDLIAEADRCLYKAKDTGRNRVVSFDLDNIKE